MASRVISRMTDSVKRLAFSETPIFIVLLAGVIRPGFRASFLLNPAASGRLKQECRGSSSAGWTDRVQADDTGFPGAYRSGEGGSGRTVFSPRREDRSACRARPKLSWNLERPPRARRAGVSEAGREPARVVARMPPVFPVRMRQPAVRLLAEEDGQPGPDAVNVLIVEIRLAEVPEVEGLNVDCGAVGSHDTDAAVAFRLPTEHVVEVSEVLRREGPHERNDRAARLEVVAIEAADAPRLGRGALVRVEP